MTEIETQALVLFKENELYKLKEMLITTCSSISDVDLEILETAIELHRMYNHIKLTEAKNKKQKIA